MTYDVTSVFYIGLASIYQGLKMKFWEKLCAPTWCKDAHDIASE